MSTAPISAHPPIYDQLVRELGDVLADTRKAAEQTQAQAREVLNFSGVPRAHADRDDSAFSAFGRADRQAPRRVED
jgi:hypothetical protein